eukprot:gnl/MRDRNA2_/MRDRNA2_53679_c0_seq1.p1 gnl/MRDRNA2_/MRDRNA2_53679_c0~~gnl/MRDRNA2_/MRDRNA2_53679_c0_seq1.p1  ORF type:complete len:349 (+),score=52.02 gnl/MRDRNA2_/MRDRNA2_53679_c0_seq1:77-1048(+)
MAQKWKKNNKVCQPAVTLTLIIITTATIFFAISGSGPSQMLQVALLRKAMIHKGALQPPGAVQPMLPGQRNPDQTRHPAQLVVHSSIVGSAQLGIQPSLLECAGACQAFLKYIVEQRDKSAGWKRYYGEIATFLIAKGSVSVVEIGTAWGGLAAHLVANVPNIKMNAVDPFLAGFDKSDSQSREYAAKQHSMMRQWKLTPNNWSDTFAQAMELNLRSIAVTHGVTYRLWHEKSTDAAPNFPDASIDAIFIDGSHTRAGVTNDLHAYWPKVKSGGFCIFNDYHNNRFPGVTAAVDFFASSLPQGLGGIMVIGNPRHGNVFIQKP